MIYNNQDIILCHLYLSARINSFAACLKYLITLWLFYQTAWSHITVRCFPHLTPTTMTRHVNIVLRSTLVAGGTMRVTKQTSMDFTSLGPMNRMLMELSGTNGRGIAILWNSPKWKWDLVRSSCMRRETTKTISNISNNNNKYNVTKWTTISRFLFVEFPRKHDIFVSILNIWIHKRMVRVTVWWLTCPLFIFDLYSSFLQFKLFISYSSVLLNHCA